MLEGHPKLSFSGLSFPTVLEYELYDCQVHKYTFISFLDNKEHILGRNRFSFFFFFFLNNFWLVEYMNE